MDTTRYHWPLLAIGLLLSLSGCFKDTCSQELTYLRVTPVYVMEADVRANQPKAEGPRALEKPSQFYYYQDHIFIVEQRKGIHIIDNTNPASPVSRAFLSVDGAENMAIRNGLLYVNNYIDLLTFDVANLYTPVLRHRAEGIFKPHSTDLQSGQLLVAYEEEMVTEVLDCEQRGRLHPWRGGWMEFIGPNRLFDNLASTAGSADTGGGTGVGGSMARFTIVGQHLYTVDHSHLGVISLQQPTQPTAVNDIYLGWGIETIFPYQDKLFIGSETGMYIFDNSNPAAPSLMSTFQHANACDPVFVQGNTAYVTLRSGNTCEGFTNQLDVIDVTDLFNPRLIRTHQMQNPHGLTIRGNHLFLCEGPHGVKVFDVTDPVRIGERQLAHHGGIHAFDAISLPGQAPITAIIGDDGFYQFRFEGQGLQLLSRIAIPK